MSLTGRIVEHQYSANKRRGINNGVTQNAQTAYTIDSFHPQRPPDMNAQTVDDVMRSEAVRSALGVVNQISENFRHRRYVYSQNTENSPMIMQTPNGGMSNYHLNYVRHTGGAVSKEYGPQNIGVYSGYAESDNSSKTQTVPYVLNMRALKNPYQPNGLYLHLAKRQSMEMGKIKFDGRPNM